MLNAISKAPEKKQAKVFKTKFAIYRKRMETNASNFFKTEAQAKDFMNTIDTIEKKIKSHIKKGKYDQKELQRQMNGLIKRSRDYQKQIKIIDKEKKSIKEAPDNARYAYVITHAVKTGIHSDECARDLANQPSNGYTKTEIDEILSRKPNHSNCTCHSRRMKNAKILIQQDNF